MPAKRNVATTVKEVTLPTELMLQVELLRLPRDLLTCKVRYGAWSSYIEGLVKADMDKHIRSMP